LQDEPRKAIADFDRVLQLDPQSPLAYNNRGYNRQQLGEYRQALSDYERAIELAPDYALAYQNKAWLLATCADDQIRDGQRAVEAAKKACELSQWQHWPDLRTLAAASAEVGDFDQAVRWQSKVVELAAEDEKPEERKVLEQYKAGQPYRSPDGGEDAAR
jgi:tetratricopeptide (TPR) repeat protein